MAMIGPEESCDPKGQEGSYRAGPIQEDFLNS